MSASASAGEDPICLLSGKLDELLLSEKKARAGEDCGVCGEEGFLFTAPCRGEHKFHYKCISRWAQVRNGLLNCPLCREHLTDYETPAPSAPSSQADAPTFSEPTITCVNCKKECFGNLACDSCSKTICGECLIKEPIAGGRLDFCPSCVKFFGKLFNARKEQIEPVLDASTFPSCRLCGSVVCFHCDINNGDDDYCVSCVNQINGIWLKHKDAVEDALVLKKAARGK